jgi:hypothetical protein
MSYNIDAVNVKNIDCYLTGKEIRKLFKKHDDNLPEINLFNNLDVLEYDDNEKVQIENLNWSGTWSGNSFDVFEEIVKQLHGTAKFSIVWEDGDVQYARLDNGILEYVEVDW